MLSSFLFLFYFPIQLLVSGRKMLMRQGGVYDGILGSVFVW